MFGGEKKCLFSRRVEEWEMRTWHHSEVGQECWSPVSFWGWKKRCKIAASLMSKQGKSRMVGMVYILFYKLGQKINDVLLTKHFLQDLNTGLWFSKDIKKRLQTVPWWKIDFKSYFLIRFWDKKDSIIMSKWVDYDFISLAVDKTGIS